MSVCYQRRSGYRSQLGLRRSGEQPHFAAPNVIPGESYPAGRSCLNRGHCAGAGVGEGVDHAIVRAPDENIEARLPQRTLTLLAGPESDRLDSFDATRFHRSSRRTTSMTPAAAPQSATISHTPKRGAAEIDGKMPR